SGFACVHGIRIRRWSDHDLVFGRYVDREPLCAASPRWRSVLPMKPVLIILGIVAIVVTSSIGTFVILQVIRPDLPVQLTTTTQSTQQPISPPLVSTPTPVPERCLLGYPNSSQVITVEMTGPGANDVCNNLVNPIRAGIPFLKNAKAMVGDHPWATYKACQFQEYGLTWTIWDVDPSRYSVPHTPGGYLCNGR